MVLTHEYFSFGDQNSDTGITYPQMNWLRCRIFY